jgi:DNA gyrase subunit A
MGGRKRNEADELAAEVERAQQQLRVLEAVEAATNDAHRVLDLLWTASEPDEAVNAVIEAFGWSEVQARAVLDVAFRRVTQQERDRISLRVTELRDWLATTTT